MAKPIARILVVDDEESIRRSLHVILTSKNYEVLLAESGEEAISIATANPPDLVILDLCMIDMSGLDVCRELRSWLTAPILVLSVIIREADKIAALDSGADDYLTKPYSIGEMLARIRALLRRTVPEAAMPQSVTFGELHVDFNKRWVTLASQEVDLTPKEYDILQMLIRHADCVVTNRQLLEYVWGPEYKYKEDLQNLRVHISNLRRKIEPLPESQHFIRNEPSVGYRFLSGAPEE
ncbi:MAG: response regulator transcription factor [Armatimonadota bacterium]